MFADDGFSFQPPRVVLANAQWQNNYSKQGQTSFSCESPFKSRFD